MLMLMFTLDIKNLYKTKKQTINSMSYYLLNILLLGIVTFYIIKSFILFFTNSENYSSLFFYNHLLIIINDDQYQLQITPLQPPQPLPHLLNQHQHPAEPR